jgi:hypothetical protein
MNNIERALISVLLGGGLAYMGYNIFKKGDRDKNVFSALMLGIVLLSIHEYRDYKAGKPSFFDFGVSKTVGTSNSALPVLGPDAQYPDSFSETEALV